MTENHNKTLTPELKEKLSKIKHLALDMDGTIYMGSTLFPFTTKFLADMKEAGISYSFLTNNPSKSVADYLKKLLQLLTTSSRTILRLRGSSSSVLRA